MSRIREDRSVGVFWDYENCSPPQSIDGAYLVNSIRKTLEKYGPIKQFRAYKDSDLNPNSLALRVELQSSGVSIIDCPHNNQKDVVDKVLIVDAMAFSREYPTATIVLIAADRDYAYMISILRSYLHHVIVITPGSRYIAMRASEFIDWKSLSSRAAQSQSSFSSAPSIFYHEPHDYIDYQPHPPSQKHGCRSALHQTPSRSQYTGHNCNHPRTEPQSPLRYPDSGASKQFITRDTVIMDEVKSVSEFDSPPVDEFEMACAVPLPCTPSAYSSRMAAEDSNEEEVISMPPVLPANSTPVELTLVEVATRRQPTAPSPQAQVTKPPEAMTPFIPDNNRIKELYGPLIRILLQFDAEGRSHPLRGVVAENMIKINPSPYLKCNARGWAEYSRTAEAAGVIILGSDPLSPGQDWVTLTATFKSPYWKSKFKVNVPETSQIPKAFAPLLQFLATCANEGRSKVPRSSACDHLLKHHRGLFEKHGYGNWRNYAVAAEEAGYVKLTGGSNGGGDTFIALDRKWRGRI